MMFRSCCSAVLFFPLMLHAQAKDPCSNVVTPKNGVYKTYYPGGGIHEEQYYEAGKAVGTWLTYNQAGAKISEVPYVNNRVHGIAYSYYPNGKPEYAVTYVNGNQRGLREYWYPGGKLRMRDFLVEKPGSYYYSYDAAVPRDTSFYWYENGQLQELGIYRDGIQQERTYWHANGRLREKVIYSDGIAYAEGTYDVFAANGRLYLRKTMRGHMQWGITETFDTLNGKRLKQTEYVRGEKQGEEIVYTANGSPEKTNYYYRDQLLLTVMPPGADGQPWFRNVPLITTSDDAHGTMDTTHMGLVRGTIRDGVYYIETIRDQYGHTMIRNGKGYYEGPAAFAGNARYDFQEEQMTETHPGDHAEMVLKQATDFLRLSLPYDDLVRSTSEFSHGRWAAGHFKNGLKEGVWREGRLKVFRYFEKKWVDIPDDAASACYATGMYHLGEKTGIWKIHIGQWTLEGAFEKNKPVGVWHSSKRTDESLYDMYQQIPSHDIDEYYPDSAPVSGSYSNGLPDGRWTVFAADGKTPACYVRFENGTLRGTEQLFYPNGKTARTFTWDGTRMQPAQCFTPEGDLLSKEQLEINKKVISLIPVKLMNYFIPEQFFAVMRRDEPDGRFYAWDPETGELLLEGFFEAGKPAGTWREWAEEKYRKKEVQCIRFEKGVHHGICKERRQGNIDSGYYAHGIRTGPWLRMAVDGAREEWIYRNDSILFWSREVGGRTEIKNGNGQFLKLESQGEETSTTAYVRNGILFRETQRFRNNSIARDLFHTPRGDSVAEVNISPGSQCVQNGTGSVTEYDKYEGTSKTKYYENGRLQRITTFSNGKAIRDIVYFTSGQTAAPQTGPYISRIMKQQEDRYLFLVTETVHNVPPDEQASFSVRPVYGLVLTTTGQELPVLNNPKHSVPPQKQVLPDGTIEYRYMLDLRMLGQKQLDEPHLFRNTMHYASVYQSALLGERLFSDSKYISVFFRDQR